MLDLNTLLEHTSDAVIALDKDFVVQEANGRAALLYRRRVDALIGKQITAIFPELTTTGALNQLQAVRAGRVPARLEIFLPSIFAWHAMLVVPKVDGLVLFARDVSDRVRREADEAVRAAVKKIIETMPLCVTITRGPQHRIEQANGLARALVGSRQVEGELVERALPEAREQGFIALLDGVYGSGQSYRGEEVELRWKPEPDATERLAYFDLTYQPLFGGSGSVEGILHLAMDVTDKVQRRRLVEQYASERQAVLEQLEEGVVLTDAEGRITFVNHAAERMHGGKLLGVGPGDYSTAYSLLTDAGDPYPSELLPLARAVREHVSVTDAVWKIRRSDSTVVRVRGNAKPVLNEGRLVACVLTLSVYD
jgi:PAS domain-containing protein